MPVPMCDRWYVAAGDYRPWQDKAPGCTCEVSAHAPDDQHGDGCPVQVAALRADLIPVGAPER